MEPVAIELEDVYAAYAGADRPAIRGVSFSLSAGELGLILGPNGAGKTTVLEVILGLLPYQAGSVRVLGEEVRRAGRRLRLSLAYLPQSLVFPPDTPYLTRDVVMMGRYGRYRPWQRLPRSERQAALSALAALGLSGKAVWPIGRLSGGEQRKALLARALAKGARVLLLDEPFASLDQAVRRELAAEVVKLRDAGLAILAVLHEDVLFTQADRAFLMREGGLAPLPEVPAGGREVWALICGG
jgi:ABC-type Mn2+/Zn2+ transport system ATPase subunit